MSTFAEDSLTLRPAANGALSSLRAAGVYLADVWRRRYFWSSLVLLDLKSKYKRSWLGIGWSLANPILTTAVLCFVFSSIFKVNLREYAPYVLSGMACWNFLAGAIVEGCLCFHQSENYLRSVRAPLAIYPLRTALGGLFHFTLIFLITILATVIAQGVTAWTPLLSLIPTILLFVVYAWSVSTVFGFVNVFFPDIHHLTGIVLQLCFYLTPVFYPSDTLSKHDWAAVLRLNPFTHMLELIRAPILYGRFPAAESYGIVVLTTTVITALALVMLRKYERKIIFYL